MLLEAERGEYKDSLKDITISPTELGQGIGCLGAALLAAHQNKRRQNKK